MVSITLLSNMLISRKLHYLCKVAPDVNWYMTVAGHFKNKYGFLSYKCKRHLFSSSRGQICETSKLLTITRRANDFGFISIGFSDVNFIQRFLSGKKINITDEFLKSPVFNHSNQEEQNSKNKDNEKSKKENSWFSAKNSWKIGLLSLLGFAVFGGGQLLLVWGAPSHDADGVEIVDEFSSLPQWQAYPKRFLKEFVIYKKMIQEPSSKKLLPDPVKEPYYQPPYTLVLELTGVLVHPDWTLSTGWRFKKRPNIDYLLSALQSPGLPLFEIVVYTHEQGMTAFPIIDGIDPRGHISYRLFRDATRYINGSHCKDLSCINRDESKVIIVDCDPKAVQLQPRNSINLRKWKGEDGDGTLVDLANFLRTIGASGVQDVRPVLDYYNQFDDPLEAFKEKQRLAQEQELAQKKAETNKPKGFVGNWAAGLGRRR